MASISDYDYELPKHLIAQQPLVKRSDARLLLVDLAVSFGQLPLHGLGLLAVLAHFGFDLPDVLVDLMAVVAAHHRRELARRGLFEEVGQLGVNVRLHMA